MRDSLIPAIATSVFLGVILGLALAALIDFLRSLALTQTSVLADPGFRYLL